MIKITDTLENKELEFNTLQLASDYLSKILKKDVAKSTIYNAGKKGGYLYKKRFYIELVTFNENNAKFGCSSDKRSKHNKWQINQFKEFPDIIHLKRIFQLYDEDMFAEIKDILKQQFSKNRFDFWYDKVDTTKQEIIEHLKERRIRCSINILLRYIGESSFEKKIEMSLSVMDKIDDFVYNFPAGKPTISIVE